MSDIVERLREIARGADNARNLYHEQYAGPLREAAAEIERLRADRAAIIEQCAKVADQHLYPGDNFAVCARVEEIAAAIRALAAQEKKP